MPEPTNLHDLAAPRLRGLRALVLTDAGDAGRHALAARLHQSGARVETQDDPLDAVERVQASSTGYGLFVMDCAAFGGAEAAHGVLAMLGTSRAALHVILVAEDFGARPFTGDRDGLTLLRAPVEASDLRAGLEAATRDRLVWRAA